VKTLILSALRCALNIKTKILILLLALTCSARARFIETGRIIFSGDFTLNHLYDFNNESAQPFGSFGTQSAGQVTGIFSPFVKMETSSLKAPRFGLFPLGTLFGQSAGYADNHI
jgi:hypothetical protein